MLDFSDLGIYTENKSLSAIRQFENKKVLRVQTGNSSFYTLRDYCAVMAPLVLRAKVLLQLYFESIQFNVLNKDSGYDYFAYIPALNTYIDYFESPWHHGPSGLARSFDPTNQIDVNFKVKYINKPEAQSTWMYRAKAMTWADADYRKLRITLQHRIPYKIFWNLRALEQLVDIESIQYSKYLQNQYLQTLKLQMILESKLRKILSEYNTMYYGSFKYESKGEFEHFDAPDWFVDSIID